jgi:hypothetical protein
MQCLEDVRYERRVGGRCPTFQYIYILDLLCGTKVISFIQMIVLYIQGTERQKLVV